MIDVHSHFLPKIDDGSKSSEMTIQMLEESYRQGIHTMVATPHFYISQNTAKQFYEKRQGAYERVLEKTKGNKNIPDIYLGAEVYYFNGIKNYDMLDMLVINGGKHILLEMPFSVWNEKILREVEALQYECGFKVVIAHIERFIPYQKGTSYIEDLLSLKPIVQMNAEYINGFWTRAHALKLIKDGTVDLLGSDCHNMEKRPPNLGKAYELLNKKLDIKYIDKINEMGYTIIS